MAHARKQIRDRIEGYLDAVPAFTGRVSSTRRRPIKGSRLPVVAVYTASEGAQENTELQTLGRGQLRTLGVMIDAYAKDSDALDDELDALAVLIEAAIQTPRKLGDLVWEVQLASTEMGVVEEKVTEPLGLVRIRYDVRYRTKPGSPEIIIN